jgi:nucleoside-diphosphate-sugar epimerase
MFWRDKEKMWKNKKVLVVGSEGMIGKELVEQLKKLKAKVYCFDIKLCGIMDVTNKENLEIIFKNFNFDYVISCFGIKGNPKMTNESPVDFMYPMLVGDANLIYLSQLYGVKKFLYTSSIAVENMKSDLYPAWAKLTAEKLIEAIRIQYPNGTEYCVVRPCNVYGQYDNLNAKECMVISDLIRKGIKNKKIELWNDGNDIRDFINAKDCARGMIQAMEQMPNKPVNLCSGKGVKIKDVAQIISNELKVPLIFGKKQKPTKRVMKINWSFKPQINIEDGIKEVIEYVNNRNTRI